MDRRRIRLAAVLCVGVGLAVALPSAAAAASGDPTANSTRPMVLVLNPTRGSVLSSAVSPVAIPFLVQVHVASPAAGGAVAAMAYTTDNTAPNCSGTGLGGFAVNPKYDVGTSGAVYEMQLSRAPASYTLRVCARNTSGAVEAPTVPFTVTSYAGLGDGNLLVRDNSAQLCNDCHALQSHNSASASNKYGSWAIGCRDCHVPHGTRNIYLVGEQITPPDYNGATGPKTVRFATKTGDSGIAGGTSPAASSYVNSDSTGPCQVCHTKTKNPSTGAPRYQFGSNTDTHFTAAAGTQGCGTCHSHTKGFAASCTGCHGDSARAGENVSPPKDTCNNLTGGRVGAHQAHLTGRGVVSSGVGCAQCHVNPPSGTHPTYALCDTNTANHAIMTWGPVATAVLAGDATPGSPTWSVSTQNCTNYCHGDFKNGNRTNTVNWNGAALSGCTSCHGSPPGGTHPANSSCGTCHTGYTSSSVVLATHVNGTVEVVPMTCSGCHGDSTRTAVATATQVDTLGANLVKASPPKDASGASPGAAGAHLAHVNQGAASPPLSNAMTCDLCHAGASSYTTSHPNSVINVSFTGIAAASGATENLTTHTCASTYCHGNFQSGNNATPTWTTAGKLGCNSCHNSPPILPHPTATDCQRCHVGYTSTTVTAATHVNGVIERSVSTGCAQCHGTSTRTFTGVTFVDAVNDPLNGIAAPPYDSAGNTLNTTRKVGAHLQHIGNEGFATSRAVQCVECHAVALPTGTDTTHANGSTSIGFTLATLAKTGGAAPTWDTVATTCASTYCHGNFTGGNLATPTWTSPASGNCGTCHLTPPVPKPAGAKPVSYHPNNPNCTACHGSGYTQTAVSGNAVATHVNGTVNHSPATGCAQCHGDLTQNAVASGAVAAAPGGVAGAVDSKGNTVTTAAGVGAHFVHVTNGNLRNALACTECHPSPNYTDAAHADGALAVPFPAGGLARTGGATNPTYSGGTCSGVYCHGVNIAAGGTNQTPTWTNVTPGNCGTCHALPPPLSAASPHPQNLTCASCHDAGYVRLTATTGTVTGGALAKHVNGTVDYLVANRSGCTMCHGDLSQNAVPYVSTGVIAAAPGYSNGTAIVGVDSTGSTNSADVGAHRAHLQQTRFRSAAILCNECHVVPANGDQSHATGAGTSGSRATLDFTVGTLASDPTFVTHTPSWNGTTCSNTYCHAPRPNDTSATLLTPGWTNTFTLVSGCTTACHGLPPQGTGHTAATGCGSCHPGYTSTSVNLATHINGQLEGGESSGNTNCFNCHKLGMVLTSPQGTAVADTGGVTSTYHHVLETDVQISTNTVYPTSATPTTVTTNYDKTCVQCHADHNVFRPDLNTSNNLGRGANLRTTIATAPPSGTTVTATPAAGNYANVDSPAGIGGICLSCHTNAQNKDRTNQKSSANTTGADTTTTTPAIDATGFSTSAHNFLVAGAISTGPSTFNVNCTKCHSSSSTQYQNGTWKFALHTSVDRSLRNPMGITTPTDPIEEAFCYRCHSRSTGDTTPGGGPAKGTADKDYFGAQSMSAKSQLLFNSFTNAAYVSKHPIAGTSGLHKATGDDVTGANRHAQCVDCHDPHDAGMAGDSGTATSATATSLTDSSKSGKWRANQWTGYKVVITGGTLGSGPGQVQTITGNTATGQINVASWNTAAGQPTNTSTYVITRQGDNSVSGATKGAPGVTITQGTVYHLGKATFKDGTNTVFLGAGGGIVSTASTATTVTATTALWTASQWNTYIMRVVTGAQAGQERTISANAASTLTVSANITLAVGDTFVIYKSGAADNPSLTPANLVGGYVRNELDRDGRWYRITGAALAGTAAYQLTITPNYVSGAFGGSPILSDTKMTNTAGSPWYMDYGTLYSVNYGTTFTATASAAKEYEICLRCHSSNAFADSPPNVPSAHQDGGAVAETNVALDFASGQLSYHPIFAAGLNQPTAVTYAGWNSNAAFTRVDNTGNSSTFGLSNTFTTGWFKESLLQCSDCHAGDSTSDPLGPHASGKKWILKGLDTTVTWVRRNSGGTGWETISNANVPSGAATETKNFCLNCHRWDVYGYIGLSGNTPASVLSRVPHDVTGNGNTYGSSNLPRSGIVCQNCHGGDRIGGAHGSSRRKYPYRYEPTTAAANSFTTGPGSYSGKRLLNGAYWFGVTRATTGSNVTCWGKNGADTVNVCAHRHQGDGGNPAQYTYDDAADPN